MILDPIWVDKPEVLAIHDRQVAEHGGSSGVRDESLLESALARARNLLAYSEEDVSLYRLAAAYAKGISSNHPFVDGNKRTALVVSFLFLALNGIQVKASREESYPIFLGLASGTVDEKDLAVWFEGHVVSRQPPLPATLQ
jgi:death-on-curing protein